MGTPVWIFELFSSCSPDLADQLRLHNLIKSGDLVVSVSGMARALDSHVEIGRKSKREENPNIVDLLISGGLREWDRIVTES